MNASATLPVVEEGLFTTDPPALVGGRCAACGTLRFPRAPVCPSCQGTSVITVPLATTGRIHTFTIVRSRPPGYEGEVPYAIGLVDLPDGIRIAATIVARDLQAIGIDDAVDFELLPIGVVPQAVLSYAFRRREVPST